MAIVTGAAKGIGRAICETMASAGWVVAGVDLLDLPAEHERPEGIRHWTADVADIGSHEPLLDDIIATIGVPDCLVNNAGVTSLRRGDLLQLSPESYDRCMAVNVRGSFFLSQKLARRLIASERRPSRTPRSIIWMGSANAEIVGEQRADYCISKAATAMMSKLFAARLAEYDICTYEIRPGIVATDMTAPAKQRYDAFIADGGVPMRRWGTATDVARAVLVIARGDLPYCTGIHVDIGGGLHLHRV